ncbi:hypothetical protein NTE19_003323 [Vibrio fluvialis]|nr:hypothetical protein [Vibrio fluvialis]
MKEKFESWRPSESSRQVVAHAQSVLTDYQEQGYTLSVRQLYYQFVARGLMENTNQNYKNLIKIVSKARLAGLLEWGYIEDRSREVKQNRHYGSPHDSLLSLVDDYQIDKWFNQEHYIEVWVEKEALIDVVGQVCRSLDVSYFACKGYGSQSELYAAGKRIAAKREAGKSPIVLHLGDHDPSGLDMTDDIESRLSLFARRRVDVRRLALNMDQVEQYAPPPNPAKVTDARYFQYAKRYGKLCWELDALEPSVISELVASNVRDFLDIERWKSAKEFEVQLRAELKWRANL